jgi:uncharacterized protein (TIGR02231 family)
MLSTETLSKGTPMLLCSLLCSLAADTTPVPSRIEDVTVYAQSALVRRRAELPGGGEFVVQGLPISLDRENVRVRCEGGDVAGVEVRERIVDKVPEERLQTLRDRHVLLQRELQTLQDEAAVQASLQAHLGELAKLSADQRTRDVEAGHTSIEAWEASWQFLSAHLADNARATRETRWKIEAKSQSVGEVEAELGKLQSGGAVRLIDVVVDVVAGGRAALDIEYLVGRTGWQPAYDLRAARDLSHAELVYRARVWQETGEDWPEVELNLSTAQPQHGAQAPEPQPVWLSVEEQSRSRTLERAGSAARAVTTKALGYSDSSNAGPSTGGPGGPATPRPFANVEDQGLSVRFQLARRETIESRDRPTTVLVGSAELAIHAERITVPAIAATVWLQAKARNTSPWVILPGTAAVFFGADYLGPAKLETVQPDQELVLALGADPSVTVTRTKVQDQAKGPGFLSSKRSLVEGWRIRLENHGSTAAAADGAVDVIVREAAPRSRDDRIRIEVSKAKPEPSDGERWKQDRDERGILTWIVHVPRAGASDIVLETTITHPEGIQLVRE